MRDPRRAFNATERIALFILAGGRCEICGVELGDDWEADHVDPHSRGGRTLITNGQALCTPCNRRKSNSITQPERNPE
jgi:5-methylcytosine-specific restriction endonuclease McrA